MMFTNSARARLAVLAVVLLMSGLAASTANAVFINYGDFNGTDVMYKDVTEASGTDPLPLYGAPIVVGNSLIFSPVDFDSSSPNATGDSDITEGQLRTTIMTTSDLGIAMLKFEEAGDFTIVGPPGAYAFASVSAPVFIRILEIDGIAIAGPTLITSFSFTPSGGEYELSSDGTSVGVTWEGTLMVDIEGLLAAHNISGKATKIDLTLNNVLATAVAGGGSATIKKKQFGLRITPVPEPSSLILGMIGLVGLMIFSRYRTTLASYMSGPPPAALA